MKVLKTNSFEQKWVKISGQEKPNQRPVWLFQHPDHNNESLTLPVHYIRFGDPPKDDNGNPLPSFNGLHGTNEPGLSVYPAYFDPVTKKYIVAGSMQSEQYLAGQNEVGHRPAYLMEGTEVGEGDDGEPCLDPKTARIIGRVDIKDMVYEQDRWLSWNGDELEGDQIPNFRNEDIMFNPKNKPMMTPEERLEKTRKEEDEKERRYKLEMEEYQKQLDMMLDIAKRFPEHRDAILARYPMFKKEFEQ